MGKSGPEIAQAVSDGIIGAPALVQASRMGSAKARHFACGDPGCGNYPLGRGPFIPPAGLGGGNGYRMKEGKVFSRFD